MKSILILSIICLLSVAFLHAEKPVNIDSLQKILPTLTGKPRIDVLNDLSWEMKYNNLELSIKYNDEALKLTNNPSYDYGKALALKNKCAVLILLGKFSEAEPYGKEALVFAQKIKDKYQQAKILNLLALINKIQANYILSIENQNKSLTLFKELKDSTEIAGGLNNLASEYELMGNTSKALEIFLQVLDIENRMSNYLGIMRTANNIGNLYERISDHKRSLIYYKKGIEAFENCKNYRFLASAYHGMAQSYLNLKMYKESEEYFLKAVQINKTNNYTDFLAINYLNLGNLYNEQERNDKAFQMFKLADKLDVENGNTVSHLNDIFALIHLYGKSKNYAQALSELAKIKPEIDSLNNIDLNSQFYYSSYYNQKMLGNSSIALDHFETYHQYKNEIDKLEDENNIKEVEAKYDVKTYEQKNALLLAQSNLQKQKIIRQKYNFYGLILLSIFILTFTFFIFMSRKNLKSLNKQLEIKNREVEEKAIALKEANAAKDKFFSIIAHDLKNPFGAIMNLSQLVDEGFDDFTSDELRTYIKEISKSSLTSYDLLVNLLDWSRSQMGVFKPNFEKIELSTLIENIIEKSNLQLESKSIKLEQQFSEKIEVIADKTMLEIVLNNLISNAIKFTPKGGKIEILNIIFQDKIQICVKDSGLGISDENLQRLFKIDDNYSTRGTENERGTGLGLILCKELIEKINGSISVESQLGKGSIFSVQLPIA